MVLALLAPLTIGLLAAAVPRFQENPRVYRSERFGLKISAPDESWIFYPQAGGAEKSLFQLTIFPKGSSGAPSVVVYVSDAGGITDPTLARDLATAKLKKLGASDLEPGSARIAGGDAPFVRGTIELPAFGKVLVRCHQRIEHGLVYTLQCARAIEDQDAEAKIEAILASLELSEPVPETEDAEAKTWRALAAKCAQDLPWASSWADASRRAEAEDRLVLVLFQNYAPLDLPDTIRTGALLDPDFALLLAERFVVLHLGVEGEAPFRDPKAYGMSKHAFGTAYMFVEPDGRVLAECGVSDASFLDEFARGVLASRKSAAKAGPGAGSALDRARAHFARGELASAEKALGSAASAESHRLRSAILRRQRRGKEALEELHAAKRVAAAGLEGDLACDEALLLMRMHRFPEARAAYERFDREWPDHARAPEAAFWLGAFDLLASGIEGGDARWKALIAAQPESPWAWKAAANLLREGCLVTGLERLDWPEPELVACASKPALAPLSAKEAARAAREAVAWLVASQREDGSWWHPRDGFSVGGNLYTPACSAICALALLEHLQANGARAGVERMLDYGLALHSSGKLEAGRDLAGVYSIWNRTFVAWTFARALRAGVGDDKELAPALQALVDSVVASQDHRGGWPYVHLPGDENGRGVDPSASFLSAGVALALCDARDAGAKVPEASIERALDFLERLRQPDATFRYMPDVPGALVDGVHPEACGRGPVCAVALRRGGRGDEELLKTTVDLFLAHRGEFKAEWHKELCHTSPVGFGAHYLFYDYLFAAQAARALPEKERERARGPLLADILAARLADGSFGDMPALGRPYATAMAVMALRELEAK